MDKNMTTKWKAHKVVSWVVAATLLMQGSTWALSEKKECLRPRSFQEASQELKKPWADRQDALMAAAALLLTSPRR